MKLSFSTLGCPDRNLDNVLEAAKKYGFDGIEIRGLSGEMYAPKMPDFAPEKLESVKAKLSSLGLEIPILSSGATFAEIDRAQASFVEACAYVDLAGALGVPFVRVKSTLQGYITPVDLRLASGLYGQLCEYAEHRGVVPLLETNGNLCSSAAMRAIIRRTGSKNSGVLWDVHHTWRYGGETPVETIANIGNYICHVHIKDSITENGGVKYVLPGTGDIPFADMLLMLHALRYEGYISLEWDPALESDLPETTELLAHYKTYMSEQLAEI